MLPCALIGSSIYLRGIATVDIELTLVDINQCDAEGKLEGALDVFRGTHHCPPTTKVSLFVPN